jgi:nucleoside-diphosphate-sugar epimerase
MTLQAYAKERDLKAASCRYVTVYGERGKEDHAVIAMIARAFIRQDPFVVWGNGQQIRIGRTSVTSLTERSRPLSQLMTAQP